MKEPNSMIFIFGDGQKVASILKKLPCQQRSVNDLSELELML